MDSPHIDVASVIKENLPFHHPLHTPPPPMVPGWEYSFISSMLHHIWLSEITFSFPPPTQTAGGGTEDVIQAGACVVRMPISLCLSIFKMLESLSGLIDDALGG